MTLNLQPDLAEAKGEFRIIMKVRGIMTRFCTKLGFWSLWMVAASHCVVCVTARAATGQTTVLQFVDPSSASVNAPIMISGGKKAGLQAGDLLKATRNFVGADFRHTMPIDTGSVKVTQVFEEHALAVVVEPTTPAAQQAFPKFPNLMAGDHLEPKVGAIQIAENLLPTESLKYSELFIDPKATPSTFELSEDGRKRLHDATLVFGGARVDTLLVQAYTDQSGHAEANQIESYQRALVIRQYLINELGFDANRVVAIGHGEAEAVALGFAPGFRDENRRVIISPVVDR